MEIPPLVGGPARERDRTRSALGSWASLEADRVDAAVALKDDSQGVLDCARFLGQAFRLDENVFLAASTAGSARASNEDAAVRKRVGLTRE